MTRAATITYSPFDLALEGGDGWSLYRSCFMVVVVSCVCGCMVVCGSCDSVE